MSTAPAHPRSRPRQLHLAVLGRLGPQIVYGDPGPGHTLAPELRLAQEHRVSRSVLRQAQCVLQAKGLLQACPPHGWRVRPVEQWNLLDPDVLAWIASVDHTARTEQLCEATRAFTAAVGRLAPHLGGNPLYRALLRDLRAAGYARPPAPGTAAAAAGPRNGAHRWP